MKRNEEVKKIIDAMDESSQRTSLLAERLQTLERREKQVIIDERIIGDIEKINIYNRYRTTLAAWFMP